MTALSPGCRYRHFSSRSTPPSSGCRSRTRGPPTSPNPSAVRRLARPRRQPRRCAGHRGRRILAVGDCGLRRDLPDAVEDGGAGNGVAGGALPARSSSRRPGCRCRRRCGRRRRCWRSCSAAAARRVLQQHLRLRHGLPRDRTVRRADRPRSMLCGRRTGARTGRARTSWSRMRLTASSIRAWPTRSGVDLGQQRVLELLGAERLHEHVGAGVHADAHLVRVRPPIRSRPGQESGGSPPSPR